MGNRYISAGMGRKVPPTSVKFSVDALARVDALAAKAGVTRSEWIQRRSGWTGKGMMPKARPSKP
jgi:hypothetical protein